jgi:hypothetical protein
MRHHCIWDDAVTSRVFFVLILTLVKLARECNFCQQIDIHPAKHFQVEHGRLREVYSYQLLNVVR